MLHHSIQLPFLRIRDQPLRCLLCPPQVLDCPAPQKRMPNGMVARSGNPSTTTSWWLNHPHLKNMFVKLDHFPNFRGENHKNLWNHLPHDKCYEFAVSSGTKFDLVSTPASRWSWGTHRAASLSVRWLASRTMIQWWLCSMLLLL